MKIRNICLIFLALINIGHTKGNNSFKIGANFSSFQNEETEWEPGLVIGAAKEWNLCDRFDGGIGLFYSNVNGIFKDKTIAPVWGMHDVDEVVHQDI